MPGEPEGLGEFVFAYGSLVHDLGDDRELLLARLRDHRRGWNVAMDNARTLPGYKYYLDARDGSRPEVHVTFLNLLPAPGEAVNGMLVPVDRERLRALDRRERNYRRREVTSAIELSRAEGARPARVWTYFGRAEACRRFQEGMSAGRAVVDKGYLDGVLRGFAALAADASAEFERSTEPHGCRVLELTRVDLA
jgi:cation transport regulator ChaC